MYGISTEHERETIHRIPCPAVPDPETLMRYSTLDGALGGFAQQGIQDFELCQRCGVDKEVEGHG